MPARLITSGLMMLACLLGSLPSLILASEFNPLGLTLGIGCWVVLYGAIGASDWFADLLRRPAMRKAIVATLILRAIVSICMPCGMIVDMFPGMMAIKAIEDLSGTSFAGFGHGGNSGTIAESAGLTAVTTLLQGVFLNAALVLGFAVLYSHFHWVEKLRDDQAAKRTTCLTCGYDLRGSLDFGRCPECGTAFAPAPAQDQGTAAGSN